MAANLIARPCRGGRAMRLQSLSRAIIISEYQQRMQIDTK